VKNIWIKRYLSSREADVRPMLFRGKNLEKKWIMGSGYAKIDYHFYVFDDEGLFRHKGLTEVDYETLGQYAVLNDKNGMMIFEGDILLRVNVESSGNTNRIRHLIYFEDGCFMMRRIDPWFCFSGYSLHEDYKKMCDLDPSFEHWSYEVIGNISDNPELLDGE
jgi:uncharacterized phage protein (TIGR01671 family)